MNVLAKAVYDNNAETGDELEFRRGDIVTVLEQNTGDLEGWWLCSLHGRQGIAPGNRLRIMAGMYESNLSPSGSASPQHDTYDVPASHFWSSPARSVDTTDGPEDEYDIPRCAPPNNFTGDNLLDPQSPTEIYDVPRASNWQNADYADEVYDVPPRAVSVVDGGRPYLDSSVVPGLPSFNSREDVYNVPTNICAPVSTATMDAREIYDVPPLVSRGPQNLQSQGEVSDEVYDVPPRRNELDILASSGMINVQDPQEIYDVPPMASRHVFRSGITSQRDQPMRLDSADSDVVYDIPQSNAVRNDFRYPIRSGLNSLRRMRREINQQPQINEDNLTSGIFPSTDEGYIYDVPPQVSKDQNKPSAVSNDDVVDGLLQRLSISSVTNETENASECLSAASRDESFRCFADVTDIDGGSVQNLGMEESLEKLISLKKNIEDVVSKMLTFVKENWRKVENISRKVGDIKKAFCEILLAVNEFIMFSIDASTSASAVNDKTGEERSPSHVQEGLKRYLKPLKEDFEMLKTALNELDDSDWDISKLVIDENSRHEITLDTVDSFVMTSRAVSDDAGQMAIYIHTHAQYIFNRDEPVSLQKNASLARSVKEIRPQEMQVLQARPLPDVPPTSNLQSVPVSDKATTVMTGDEAWLEDYDYVALQKDDELEQVTIENSSPGDLISGLQKRQSKLTRLEELANNEKNAYNLAPDTQANILKLEIDVQELMTSLSQSIKRAIEAVHNGHPPHTFVGLTKQVVLCAHRMVFVGDCLNQRIKLPAARDMLHVQCESMCAALKRTVVSAKFAALQWPSVPAVQDMVDKMYDVATCAQQIKLELQKILPV